jgi:hypothetical protein
VGQPAEGAQAGLHENPEREGYSAPSSGSSDREPRSSKKRRR